MKEKLCFALDVNSGNEAQLLINELSPYVGVFKVGPELLTASGPALIHMVKASGAKCFLDLKLHDIPETVSRTVIAAKAHGVDFLTVHASGGADMLKAALEAAGDKVKLLGITALTSLSIEDCNKIYEKSRYAVTEKFLRDIHNNKIPGCVLSVRETKWLKKYYPDLFYVTPGIRLEEQDTPTDDQKQTGTPKQAVQSGSDLLVVGRPIKNAKDKIEVCKSILESIGNK